MFGGGLLHTLLKISAGSLRAVELHPQLLQLVNTAQLPATSHSALCLLMSCLCAVLYSSCWGFRLGSCFACVQQLGSCLPVSTLSTLPQQTSTHSGRPVTSLDTAAALGRDGCLNYSAFQRKDRPASLVPKSQGTTCIQVTQDKAVGHDLKSTAQQLLGPTHYQSLT